MYWHQHLYEMLARGKEIVGLIENAMPQTRTNQYTYETIDEQRVEKFVLDALLLVKALNNKICQQKSYEPTQRIPTERPESLHVWIPDNIHQFVHNQGGLLYVKTEVHDVAVLHHIVLALQISYLFSYADWLDWWNSPVFCQLAVMSIVTLAFCLWRMLTIRHPYYEPKMWTYRHLAPVLILITLVEAFLATEYVLEEVYYEEVMHYSEEVSVWLDWFAIVGIVCGCAFSYWWMHTCRRSYLRLCTIGIAALIGYLFGFYSLMTTDIHISQLALPVACRGFAYAALCCAFFVWLHEIMSFQHFFQALSVFNFLHAVMGGVFGCAVYARCLAYLVPDNFARYSAAIDRVSFSRAPFALGEYMEGFVSQMMEVSIKQIYGAVLYAAIILFLLFLLYDMPMRRHLRRIPMWSAVQRKVMGAYKNMRGG